MACGTGCCAVNRADTPPTPPPRGSRDQSVTSEDRGVDTSVAGGQEEMCGEDGREECCGGGSRSEEEEGCCTKETTANDGVIDDSSTSAVEEEESCGGDCCTSTLTTPLQPRTVPDGNSSCCQPAGQMASPVRVESMDVEKSTACGEGCCDSGEASSEEDDTCDSDEDNCDAGCCGTAKEDVQPLPATCCDSKKSETCCSSIRPQPTSLHAAKHPEHITTTSLSATTDLEKGPLSKYHVILSVSGMTCTGCETKLQRTLSSLPQITNLKTSLVLARAEFDMEDSKGSMTCEEVIKHLHRTTEFKCERVSNQGCSLDFECDGNGVELVDGKWPDGVLEVRIVGKGNLRVEYNPKIIGARDLLDKEWAKDLRFAPPCGDAGLEAGSKHVRNMGFMMLLSAVLTIPVLVMAWAPLPKREVAYGSASLALATLVQVVVAGPFYPKAVKALIFSRVIEMDLLIVLSTSAAYVFSVVSFGYLIAGQPLSTGEFFETSTLLVTLIMVGRFVASLARQKAAESISIRSLQVTTAVLVKDDGSEMVLDARLLQFGDVFKVSPESRIPTDGTVISGSSEVDESMLTGESRPVEKHTGSAVVAGSINGLGVLLVRLTRLPGDNTITTIACMVDEAKLSKPKIQDIADKVASYFVPVVVALTIITFVIWVAIGVAVRQQSGSQAVIDAITYAITVLIVSCPCAIGLAVPMVIVIASGVAARRGVIFKTAASIEVAYKTTDCVFDKTGTLTQGKLAVVDEVYLGEDQELDKSLLLGMLADIKHPVSAAVAAHLSSTGVVSENVHDPKALPGKGVKATFKRKELRAGNSRWLDKLSHPTVRSMLSAGLTVFCFTIDDSLVAVFGLQDTLRLDALSTISALRDHGVRIHLLSGDDDGAVRAIASQLSVPESNMRSRCSPGDKQAYVQGLLAEPPLTSKAKKPVVMFVGDGTNDAVALAQATVGVHISSGTDMAQAAADIVLVRPNLAGVLSIIAVSRKAMHRVAFNFVWSFVYNTFAVLLGAGAFVHARIPPEYAGLGELVSVLPVVLAAVLLRWEKI